MDQPNTATIRAAGVQEVDVDNLQTVDLDELIGRQRESLTADGTHAWVLSLAYALTDPEMALDSMELGVGNLVGISPIYCLVCYERYNTVNRYYKCSQMRPVTTAPGGPADPA